MSHAIAVLRGGTMSGVGISDAIRNIMLGGPVSADPRSGVVALEGSAPMTPEEKREYNRTYYAQHREQHRANGKAWRDANRERARANERAASLARYHANPEKARAKGRADMAAAYERGWRQGPRSLRAAWLKWRYGITPEQWQEMFDAQGGLCGICHGPQQGKRRLGLDHNHETGKVRGLLCDRCNLLVGKVETGQPVKADRGLIEEWIARSGIGTGSKYTSPSGWAPSESQPQRPRGRPRLEKEV